MNEQPKSKVLIIIIGILLIANLIMLSIFFIGKPGKTKTARPDKQAYINSYLKNEIGFTDEQFARYDSLGNNHRTEARSQMNALSEQRKNIFKDLALRSFTDSAVDHAAALIAEQQKIFEIKVIRHIKDIRNICTPAQLPRFDTGFYKIIGKRGERSQENKKQ
jgi:Na+-transporting NADH:ubiquinone oxidoreductase subunit NqrC